MAINSQVGWKTRNVDFSLFPPVLISRFPMRHDLAAVNLLSLFASFLSRQKAPPLDSRDCSCVFRRSVFVFLKRKSEKKFS